MKATIHSKTNSSKSVVNFYDYCKVYQMEQMAENKLKLPLQEKENTKYKTHGKYKSLKIDLSSIQAGMRPFKSSLHNFHQSSAQQQILMKIKERRTHISRLSSTVLSDLIDHSFFHRPQSTALRPACRNTRVRQLDRLRKNKMKAHLDVEGTKLEMSSREGDCPISIVKKYCQEEG